jgi:hypothetical protein
LWGGTIPKEIEAEIVRLYHGEKWPIGTIAGQLGIHHTTVQRVLRQTGVDRKIVAPRPSMIDPYVPFIVEQLEKYPGLRASRLFVMIKERGYPAGPIISGVSSVASAAQSRGSVPAAADDAGRAGAGRLPASRQRHAPTDHGRAREGRIRATRLRDTNGFLGVVESRGGRGDSPRSPV